MAFKVIEKSTTGGKAGNFFTRNDQPMIKFVKNHYIFLNRQAQAIFENYDHVVLLFDEETNRLAIKPSTKDDENSIVISNHQGRYRINMNKECMEKFSKYFGMAFFLRKRVEDGLGAVFVADLNEVAK